MDRTIKVTSDRVNEMRKHLDLLGHMKETQAQNDYGISLPLYSELFFAPNKTTTLGAFYPDEKYIILNEILLEDSLSINIIENIFLHELAHSLDYAINGYVTGHSSSFRSYCGYLGIEQGFEKARVKKQIRAIDSKSDRLRKLMALAASPFENEAMIALSKAQRLMIEERKENRQSIEEKLYIAELYESKKISFHVTKLCSFISKATGVFIVRCRESNGSILRAYGDLDEVEFAIYLFDYILDSLNKTVARLRREGLHITKDSFISGAIPEMEAKLFHSDKSIGRALVLVQNENRDKTKRLVFNKGLRTIKYSSRQISKPSFQLGSSFAKELDIPSGIKQRRLTE